MGFFWFSPAFFLLPFPLGRCVRAGVSDDALRAGLLSRALQDCGVFCLTRPQTPRKPELPVCGTRTLPPACHTLAQDCRSLIPSSQVMTLLIVICTSPHAGNNLSLEAVFIERVCIHSYMASLHPCFQLSHHTYSWQNNRALSLFLLPTCRHWDSLDRHKYKFIAINHLHNSLEHKAPRASWRCCVTYMTPSTNIYMAALSALTDPSSN